MAKALKRHGAVGLRGQKYLYFLCFFSCFMIALYKIEAFLFGSILSQGREKLFMPSLDRLYDKRLEYVDQRFWSDVHKLANVQPRGFFFGFNMILSDEEIDQWQLKRHRYLINETKFFRSRNETPFMPPVVDLYLSYLKPTNTFYTNSSAHYMSTATRYAIEDIIRTGFNLEPHRLGWKENGIVYQAQKIPRPAKRTQNNVQKDRVLQYEARVPFDEKLFYLGRKVDRRDRASRKIILWHSPSSYTNAIPDLQYIKTCPHFPCLVTTNRTVYQDKSSAVIFPAESIKGNPPRRVRPAQIFIFHNVLPYTSTERQLYDFSKPEWKSVFNWTFTYRLDSDIVLPYGVVRKRPRSPMDKDYDKILAEKKGMIAYVASNCFTSGQRELYVKNLQNFTRVDIIGNCGNINCSKSRAAQCADQIAKQYKFVLAFESALCPDYVTEKFFYYLNKDTVVVARGSNDYFLHVPSETFINTNNFPSPRMLARTLNYLDQNKEAYIELLRAKDKYMAIFDDHPMMTPRGLIDRTEYLFSGVPMCQVCQRLWNLDVYAKRINDIHTWFDRKICRLSTDLSFYTLEKKIDLI